jgi:hypothetical protein
MSLRSSRSLGFAVLLAAGALARPAAAESIIKHPGDHPKYGFEAEPHLAFAPFGSGGFGPGFRGTVVLVDNGFVSTINNSIGLGFGIDYVFFGNCHGPFGDRRCDNTHDVILPLVLQWNFWLHPNWSVFGEPGIAFHLLGGGNDHFAFDYFTFYAGGRYHFNDSIALTLRAGAPFFHENVISLGVSFLL